MAIASKRADRETTEGAVRAKVSADKKFGALIARITSYNVCYTKLLRDNLRLKAGIHVVQFSGVDGVYKALPVLSAHAKLSKQWQLIMGSLKGDVHHHLIEPVFNTESQYTRPLSYNFV